MKSLVQRFWMMCLTFIIKIVSLLAALVALFAPVASLTSVAAVAAVATGCGVVDVDNPDGGNGNDSGNNVAEYCPDVDGDREGVLTQCYNTATPPPGWRRRIELNPLSDCDDNRAQANHSAPELCGNHLDDDCDGQVDEGCDSCSGVVCPIGETCSNGVCVRTCMPSVEVCDGIDNDCNGTIDVVNGSSVCNVVNPCQNYQCQNGYHCVINGSSPSCIPNTNCAPVELCDDVDNDCDGMIDEGCREACTTDRRFQAELNPGIVQSWCPSGIQLVYYDHQGNPVWFPVGRTSIDTTLPAAWSCGGTMAVHLFCEGRGYYDWTAFTGRTAQEAGLRLRVDGRDMSTVSLVCNFFPNRPNPVSWTTPRVPLESGWEGRCQQSTAQ